MYLIGKLLETSTQSAPDKRREGVSGAKWTMVGLFGALALCILFVGHYGDVVGEQSFLTDDDDEPYAQGVAAITAALPPTPSTTIWSATQSTDRMTGEQSCYVTSERLRSESRMSFPYHDMRAFLGIGRKGGTTWTYIGFTHQPILANSETKSGHDEARVRVQWNNDPATVRRWLVTQEWGDRFLHLDNDAGWIARLRSGDLVRVELDLYGEGQITWSFPLVGVTKTLGECSIRPPRPVQVAEAQFPNDMCFATYSDMTAACRERNGLSSCGAQACVDVCTARAYKSKNTSDWCFD